MYYIKKVNNIFTLLLLIILISGTKTKSDPDTKNNDKLVVEFVQYIGEQDLRGIPCPPLENVSDCPEGDVRAYDIGLFRLWNLWNNTILIHSIEFWTQWEYIDPETEEIIIYNETQGTGMWLEYPQYIYPETSWEWQVFATYANRAEIWFSVVATPYNEKTITHLFGPYVSPALLFTGYTSTRETTGFLIISTVIIAISISFWKKHLSKRQ